MTKDLVDHARAIQLGAYYRVRQRLPDMHAALTEGRMLVVTAYTHDGWLRPAADTARTTRPERLRARAGHNEPPDCWPLQTLPASYQHKPARLR